MEESSVSSGDEDKLEGTEKGLSREKKIKKVDIANPLSTFEKQNRQRKQHFTTSAFVKEKWLYLRGMNGDGKFVTEDDAKTDTWPSPTGCSRSTLGMCLRTHDLMKDFTP